MCYDYNGSYYLARWSLVHCHHAWSKPLQLSSMLQLLMLLTANIHIVIACDIVIEAVIIYRILSKCRNTIKLY